MNIENYNFDDLEVEIFKQGACFIDLLPNFTAGIISQFF